MRAVRFVVFAVLLAVAAIPSASALDIIKEPNVLADGVVGQPYLHEFEGEEGCPPSYHFALDNDSELPPGLVLHSNGELKGTPATPGDWSFWVELTDGDGGPNSCRSAPSQGIFHIRILPTLVIESQLYGTLAGRPVNTQLAGAGGGTHLWSISAGALPPGLTLSEKGILSGATSALGTHTFTVKLQDPGPKRVATKQFSYVVANPLSAAAPAARPGEVGRAVNVAQTVAGGIPPLRWSVASGSLPAGLTLDAATGALSGTPTAAGSFPVGLTVTDAEGTVVPVNATLSIAARLALTTTRLPQATVGKPYRAGLAVRGGVRPVVWRVLGALPRGIRFDAKTVRLVGTPLAAGTRRITLQATDSLGARASKPFVLVVKR